MPVSTRPYRRHSTFGHGQRVPVDREFHAVYKAKLRLNRRPNRLTFAAVEVAHYLLRTIGPDGQLDPCNATIAAACGIAPSTAADARVRLRRFGFLSWDCRLRRDAGTGWRTAQTSNAYRLQMPAVAPAVRCDTDFRKGVDSRGLRIESGGIEVDRANAARQLRALGATVPLAWGSV